MRGDSIGGPIRWRMHIPAPPDKVFAVLDSDSGRASFWAESEVEAHGEIEFQFVNGYTHKSKIVERRPPALLMIDYLGGHARFELASDG